VKHVSTLSILALVGCSEYQLLDGVGSDDDIGPELPGGAPPDGLQGEPPPGAGPNGGPPGDRPDGPPGGAEGVRERLMDVGLRAVPPPPDLDEALVDLGQALFFDPVLSGNRDVSCASCHHPDAATSDDEALSLGVLGRTPRHAPALYNLHVQPSLFWDGRVAETPGGLRTPAGDLAHVDDVLTLGAAAAQAMFPVTSALEMRGAPGDNELADLDDDEAIWAGLMDRLVAIDGYRERFAAAYPDTATDDLHFAHAANAIAAFEIWAFAATEAPVDRFLAGEVDSLSGEALAGADAFLRAGCARCHRGPAGTDNRAHTTAVPQLGPGVEGDGADLGAFAVTDEGRDRYAFRTPPLVMVAETGPWGHDGAFADLEAFVGHYDRPEAALRAYDVRANVDDATLWDDHVTATDDEILERLDPLTRTGPFDAGAVVAFLEAWTDEEALGRDVVPSSVPSGLAVGGQLPRSLGR